MTPLEARSILVPGPRTPEFSSAMCVHLSRGATMTTSQVQIATCTNITLDQILESAVVLSWKDLLPGTRTNLVHVEYRLGPGGSLEFLKIWSSITRGHQYLVCEWSPSPAANHVDFSNDFCSK